MAKKRINYREHIKSEIWQQQSQERRDEAGRCQLCGIRTKRLHCHHNCYKHLGDERYHDLIVLCSYCHALFHTLHKYDSKRHHFYRSRQQHTKTKTTKSKTAILKPNKL